MRAVTQPHRGYTPRTKIGAAVVRAATTPNAKIAQAHFHTLQTTSKGRGNPQYAHVPVRLADKIWEMASSYRQILPKRDGRSLSAYDNCVNLFRKVSGLQKSHLGDHNERNQQ